jgi:hypothetical protein
VYQGSGEQGKDIARGLERYYYDMDVLEYDAENVANDKVPLRGHPREQIRARAAADHLRGCQ